MICMYVCYVLFNKYSILNESEAAVCMRDGRCADADVDAGSKYLAAFIVSMVLQGFGAVPLYVLGVTYLDDASAHGTASVHIGNDVLLNCAL